jgi:outer membrane putative beta-barrel porin/alpha-amylase
MRIKASRIAAYLVAMVFIGGANLCRAAETGGYSAYLSDRGDGIPTSLLGTYIRAKEFIFYPFYEYTRSNNFEYAPKELGVTTPGAEQEFSGKLVEREALLFFAYAFNDSLAIEFESAVWASVDFTKASNDNAGTPATIHESGLGDTEMNIRWRTWKETATRPELTLFFKTVFPLQKNKLLGEQYWEFEPGFALTKGYSFGTLTFKLAAAYDTGERKAEFSEWSVDYLKRINSQWRVALSLEAAQTDEMSIIGELQYTLSKNAVLKLNSGFGLSKKAPDIAPEIGVLFRF